MCDPIRFPFLPVYVPKNSLIENLLFVKLVDEIKTLTFHLLVYIHPPTSVSVGLLALCNKPVAVFGSAFGISIVVSLLHNCDIIPCVEAVKNYIE